MQQEFIIFIRNCNITLGSSDVKGTYSFYLDNSNGSIYNNIVENSYYDIYNGTQTTFFNNTFINIIKSSMIVNWVGNSSNASSNFISILRPNSTIPSKLYMYNITLRPQEVSLGNITENNGVIGNFTPSRIGTYSSIINATDDFNNTIKLTNYKYKVDEKQKLKTIFH